MVKLKEFKDIDGRVLIIMSTKKSIIFKSMNEIERSTFTWRFNFRFKGDIFKNLIEYLESTANKMWDDFMPKEATSIRSDYDTYYDRKFDSEGGLYLKENGFVIERPSLDSPILYKFNKARLESFIFDVRKKDKED